MKKFNCIFAAGGVQYCQKEDLHESTGCNDLPINDGCDDIMIIKSIMLMLMLMLLAMMVQVQRPKLVNKRVCRELTDEEVDFISIVIIIIIIVIIIIVKIITTIIIIMKTTR